MIKTIVKVGGMACGMCEEHVCDAIRAGVPGAEKVRASHTKGEAEFLTETAVEEELVKK